MTTFSFDTPVPGSTNTLSATGTSASVSFVDNGVAFTISTAANTGPFTGVFYSPGGGQVSITDEASNIATWTLTANGAGVNFDGSGLQLNVQQVAIFGGPINPGQEWAIIFVDTLGVSHTVQYTGSGSSVINAPTIAADYSQIKFVMSGTAPTALQIYSMDATIVCYLEDTGINTPKGRVAVQDLREGDRICLADGGETIVKWVGIQPVDTRTAHPAKVNPICITAGSIADNVPERDLFVSPDHAIEIDGRLYNASALVNGASIYKVAQMPQAGFTYYHIETEAHEVILAEGCPAESYLDMPDRAGFVNGAERADAARIAEMPLPRIVAKRMVPADVADRLAARIKHRTAA